METPQRSWRVAAWRVAFGATGLVLTALEALDAALHAVCRAVGGRRSPVRPLVAACPRAYRSFQLPCHVCFQRLYALTGTPPMRGVSVAQAKAAALAVAEWAPTACSPAHLALVARTADDGVIDLVPGGGGGDWFLDGVALRHALERAVLAALADEGEPLLLHATCDDALDLADPALALWTMPRTVPFYLIYAFVERFRAGTARIDPTAPRCLGRVYALRPARAFRTYDLPSTARDFVPPPRGDPRDALVARRVGYAVPRLFGCVGDGPDAFVFTAAAAAACGLAVVREFRLWRDDA